MALALPIALTALELVAYVIGGIVLVGLGAVVLAAYAVIFATVVGSVMVLLFGDEQGWRFVAFLAAVAAVLWALVETGVLEGW